MNWIDLYRDAISHAIDEPLSRWAVKNRRGRKRLTRRLLDMAIVRDRLLAEVGKIEAEHEGEDDAD